MVINLTPSHTIVTDGWRFLMVFRPQFACILAEMIATEPMWLTV